MKFLFFYDPKWRVYLVPGTRLPITVVGISQLHLTFLVAILILLLISRYRSFLYLKKFQPLAIAWKFKISLLCYFIPSLP